MTTVQKWGGSLGVRIPKSVADQFSLENGSKVEVKADRKGIFVKPVDEVPTLEELLAGITDENRHEEIDWGKPEGKEVW
ncbi:AbrB/MazE/SpoVT family DNA-binding domain-containing protein [Lentibacillus jeotgali]|uniref:AbrB/MazE/SpoVT family DNA-binding domain-containing protein n=1 Tax=Lentibacillus jeotgali TaxID=558169 RepID=UPI000593197A|nr:AbrB/MazE/SpoVT family DNA-binding domain-containing protein [Lentibacillus jeotgali]